MSCRLYKSAVAVRWWTSFRFDEQHGAEQEAAQGLAVPCAWSSQRSTSSGLIGGPMRRAWKMCISSSAQVRAVSASGDRTLCLVSDRSAPRSLMLAKRLPISASGLR
jgi:hypothetical protein